MAEATRKSSNVVWHPELVQRSDRERLNGHKSALLWLTGLSGAGKSTLAQAVAHEMQRQGFRSYVLDGDNVRHGLCADLGFSDSDRVENIRRIGEMAKLFVDAGIITLTAFISPFRADRDRVRAMLSERDFFEIHCACSLEVCEQRDVKGLYRKARAGLISDFTGISSPYEAPNDPELVVHTDKQSLQESAAQVIDVLRERGIVPARP
jgi:adenylylsulfate kinase